MDETIIIIRSTITSHVVLLIFTGNSTLTYQLFPFTNAKYTYVSIVRVTFYTFQVELP